MPLTSVIVESSFAGQVNTAPGVGDETKDDDVDMTMEEGTMEDMLATTDEVCVELEDTGSSSDEPPNVDDAGADEIASPDDHPVELAVVDVHSDDDPASGVVAGASDAAVEELPDEGEL